MSRPLSVASGARQDAILAVLRDAESFPLSTGQIARALGMKQVLHGWSGKAYCSRCDGFHAAPVWREMEAQDVRALLNRLAKAGTVEKVVLQTQRHHYWRAA